MPYYLDTTSHLHYLDSSEFEYLLPAGCTLLTDEEAAALLAPTTSQLQVTKQEEITAYQQALLATPFTFGIYQFPMSTVIMDYYRDAAIAVSLGATPEAGFGFTNSAGAKVLMTKVEVMSFFRTAYEYYQQITLVTLDIIAAMLASPDPASFDVSAAFLAAGHVADGWDEAVPVTDPLPDSGATDGGTF